MANLQIKDFPDEMHAALRQRAREEHVTMSHLATEMIERELARIRLNAWIAKRDAAALPRIDVDVVALLDEVRQEYAPR
ncbi:FitA-like ribbon-helix-helix domain-containing protein [Rathayibacter soli]|uniref:FitA-like ribbon-helix-helix domain-containing protein n=1 Tax=Rathayibacter soli TaxID=3144168 RepID=UPI0027E54E18|nr:hypothetical protein [Glaciibacter superstes]